MPIISILISSCSLVISLLTLWLTLLRKGKVKMTKPTLIFFGPDGGNKDFPKIYLRTLLYCTAKRPQIIESMFVKVFRGESIQTFNIWTYGERDLKRGSGICVGQDGITCNHHFLLPHDGTRYEFLAGDYKLETYINLVGKNKPILLCSVNLNLSEQQARDLKEKIAGVFFDWGPDSGKYYAHIDEH